jgi:hypothetical protein
LHASDPHPTHGASIETRRGHGPGSFSGRSLDEVPACPLEGVDATCSESSESYAYDILYYYANADLAQAEMDCAMAGNTWMTSP